MVVLPDTPPLPGPSSRPSSPTRPTPLKGLSPAWSHSAQLDSTRTKSCGEGRPLSTKPWQEAAVAVHHTFLERELRPLLGETEEALLRSQGGPLASVPFTSLPTMRESSDPQPFRLLLLRPPPPSPLSPRWCRCGSRAGHRGCPMETGATWVCSTVWMAEDSRSSLMASPSGEESKLMERCAQERHCLGGSAQSQREEIPRVGRTWRKSSSRGGWCRGVASLQRHPSFSAVLCLPRFGVCFRLSRGRLLQLGCVGGAQ